MGWTFTHRDRGMTTQEFFEREFPNTLVKDGEIVACNATKDAFYAAVRDREDGIVWAFVALTERVPAAFHNYGYKEMDETSGPGVHGASRKVLDALTPTTNEYALAWRERVAATLDRPRPKPGDTIRLAQPVTFTSGLTEDTFHVRKTPALRGGKQINRTTIHAASTGGRVRLDLDRMPFEIVTAA